MQVIKPMCPNIWINIKDQYSLFSKAECMKFLQGYSSLVNVMRALGLKVKYIVHKAGRYTDKARKVNWLPLHTQSIEINVWRTFK